MEQYERVPLVPRHALGRDLGLCPELATAAARWRPSGARVCVAETGKLQREGKRAARSSGATRGCHGEQEVACGPPRRRAAPFSAVGREKQRSREVGDEVWTDLQKLKSSRVPL